MNRMGGLPAWSAVYAVFDDVALEALANRGLVRRGRVEVAAGRVGVQEAGRPTGSANEMVAESTESAESAETLTVAVGRPAVPVVLTAGGPQEARCPCPVAGVCIHVVAACLWMREAVAAEAPAEPDPAGPLPLSPGPAARLRTSSRSGLRNPAHSRERASVQPVQPMRKTLKTRRMQPIQLLVGRMRIRSWRRFSPGNRPSSRRLSAWPHCVASPPRWRVPTRISSPPTLWSPAHRGA